MVDSIIGKVQDVASPRLTHVVHGAGPRSHLTLRILHCLHESCCLFLLFA
jgi:hypothetical protein